MMMAEEHVVEGMGVRALEKKLSLKVSEGGKVAAGTGESKCEVRKGKHF